MITKYGFEIEDSHLNSLSRMDTRRIISLMLEDEIFKNAEPVSEKYEDSVLHNNETYHGASLAINKWDTYTHLLDFNQKTSSSDGWIDYELCGLYDKATGASSLAKISVIRSDSYSTKTISHSMVIHYRKLDRSFYVYSGNIEDFYNQVYNAIKLRKLSEKYGI